MHKETAMVDFERQALDSIDAHQDELFFLLSQLIQFDTQNFITSGRERECQFFIADLYRNLGLETAVYFPGGSILFSTTRRRLRCF
jgi:acetylornithine deacetylase/succinyl-diaminopimelate desuccinylase-like protein